MVFRSTVLVAAILLPASPPAGADEISTTSTYFTVRRDSRTCAQPLCGGYWVKRANASMTLCGNGSYQSECYAASIDWKATGLSATQTVAFQTEIAAGRGLIRGTFTTRSYPEAGSMTIFAATEAWRAASANPPGGTFFRLTDNGIRCATTPCFWIHGARLNSPVDREISSLDLGAAGITAERSRTLLSTVGARGFLAAGTLKSVAREGPAGDGVRLIASQVYLRVQP